MGFETFTEFCFTYLNIMDKKLDSKDLSYAVYERYTNKIAEWNRVAAERLN